MAMVLQNVAPIGRSFEEYLLMFGLNEKELGKKILGIGDGPASFNAEMKELGNTVTSVDPLYEFEGTDIERRFYEVIDGVLEQMIATPGDWTWGYHDSPEHLRLHREQAIVKFIRDYEGGKNEGRYVTGELPKLEFKDGAFDLALCSHFLFLYTEHFDYDFHRESIYELLRVADEVRIFPLLDLMRNRSRYIDRLSQELGREGYTVEIKRVEYEMQKGGNEMMRILRG